MFKIFLLTHVSQLVGSVLDNRLYLVFLLPTNEWVGLIGDGLSWVWCGMVIGTIVLGNVMDIQPPPLEFVRYSVKVTIVS